MFYYIMPFVGWVFIHKSNGDVCKMVTKIEMINKTTNFISLENAIMLLVFGVGSSTIVGKNLFIYGLYKYHIAMTTINPGTKVSKKRLNVNSDFIIIS